MKITDLINDTITPIVSLDYVEENAGMREGANISTMV
jgi:hypothetical protein